MSPSGPPPRGKNKSPLWDTCTRGGPPVPVLVVPIHRNYRAWELELHYFTGGYWGQIGTLVVCLGLTPCRMFREPVNRSFDSVSLTVAALLGSLRTVDLQCTPGLTLAPCPSPVIPF